MCRFFQIASTIETKPRGRRREREGERLLTMSNFPEMGEGKMWTRFARERETRQGGGGGGQFTLLYSFGGKAFEFLRRWRRKEEVWRKGRGGGRGGGLLAGSLERHSCQVS